MSDKRSTPVQQKAILLWVACYCKCSDMYLGLQVLSAVVYSFFYQSLYVCAAFSVSEITRTHP